MNKLIAVFIILIGKECRPSTPLLQVAFNPRMVLTTGISLPPQNNPLAIHHLSGDFYVYTTYRTLNGKPFPSNSMYVVTDSGAVMFDTPWDTAQFQPLLDSIWERHQKEVVLCIATHYHDDRTAGLDFLKQKGISTWSSKQTFDLCAAHGEKQAESYFIKDTIFTIGKHTFLTYYPGEGPYQR